MHSTRRAYRTVNTAAIHYTSTNCMQQYVTQLTFRRPLLPYLYNYKAFCARPG